MRFLGKPAAILGCFVGFKATQAIYALAVGSEGLQISIGRLMILSFWVLASYYAYRGNRAALYFMAVAFVLHIFGFAFALFAAEENLLKGVSLLLGAYFLFSLPVLIGLARQGPEKGTLQGTE